MSQNKKARENYGISSTQGIHDAVPQRKKKKKTASQFHSFSLIPIPMEQGHAHLNVQATRFTSTWHIESMKLAVQRFSNLL
jgi:hypothetical protein